MSKLEGVALYILFCSLLVLLTVAFSLHPTRCNPDNFVYPCLYRTQPNENMETIAARNGLPHHNGYWLCRSNNLDDEWWELSEQERDDIRARLQAIHPAFKPGPCSYFQRGGVIRIEPQPEGWTSWQ